MPSQTSEVTSRRLSGLKAKRQGEAFEALFHMACQRARIACTRFPEGCKRVAGRAFGGQRLIQIRTPWDWILTHNGRSAFLDTKSCAGKSFPHSAIEPHQLSGMIHHEKAGAIAGYVIWLRDINQMFFVAAKELYTRIGVRGSVREDDACMVYLGEGILFDPARIFI